MGWMQRLVETYDRVIQDGAAAEAQQPLIPLGFIEKKASFRVTLNESGEFAAAERLTEEVCVVPTAPLAESRTGSALPFPLSDELRYVAGDAGEENERYYQAYMQKLDEWCRDGAPAGICLLRDYLARRTLLADMRSCLTDMDLQKDLKGGFVCFSVRSHEVEETRLERREDVRTSWRNRVLRGLGDEQLCYVEGVQTPILENHAKIQGSAKLISAKDGVRSFQFKGRFEDDAQAMRVGAQASIKAHNALRWLLKRQGFNRYGMMMIAWSPGGGTVVNPCLAGEALEEVPQTADTMREYGEAIVRMLKGRRQDLTKYDPQCVDTVVFLGLEAATIGRMSVSYYQELQDDLYARNLQEWYESCVWIMPRYDKKEGKYCFSYSTPTFREIAEVVLGTQAVRQADADMKNDKSVTKLVKQLVLRLTECLVERRPLPRDLLAVAFHRVVAPHGFTDQKGKWQQMDWERALSTACAMFRRNDWMGEGSLAQENASPERNQQGVYDVKLDEACTERNYLYGRLLAVVDVLELDAMNQLGKDNADSSRQTNAIRYMQRFQQRPSSTWLRLHQMAMPYLDKLVKNSPTYAIRYQKLIGQIEELLQPGDVESAEPLDRRFLQGYYAQRQALFTPDKQK